MEERRFVRLFLVVPTIVVLYFVYQIFEPFLMPAFLAAVLAMLCFPVYAQLRSWLRGRSNWAALITCLAVTAIIIVPFVLLIVSLAGQATEVYQTVQRAIQNPESDVEQWLDPVYWRQNPIVGGVLETVEQYLPVDITEIPILDAFSSGLQTVSGFFVRYSTAIVTGVAHLITNFFVMIVCMFFFFRDGGRLLAQFKTWTPLSESYETIILDKFRGVAQATVLGSLLTAMAQGAAGGLVFWILGIPNAMLWGTMMAIFSLVPVIGTAIIWVPWAIFLLASGSPGRALGLVVAALLFVGMIDNVLRPMLIEGQAKMHTLLVFFSIMGGISYFGIIGMIIGPIVVALGLTFMELYKVEFRDELEKRPGLQD